MWIFTVNSDWEFLGIPNHNKSSSKDLEIPRNSQKFSEIPSLQPTGLGIPRNSNSAPMTLPEKL